MLGAGEERHLGTRDRAAARPYHRSWASSIAPDTANDIQALVVKYTRKNRLYFHTAQWYCWAPPGPAHVWVTRASPPFSSPLALITERESSLGISTWLLLASSEVTTNSKRYFHGTFHPRDLKLLLLRPGINPSCLPTRPRRTGTLRGQTGPRCGCAFQVAQLVASALRAYITRLQNQYIALTLHCDLP